MRQAPRKIVILWGAATGFCCADPAAHPAPGHIKAPYRKLAAHTRAEAVFEAAQQGRSSFEQGAAGRRNAPCDLRLVINAPGDIDGDRVLALGVWRERIARSCWNQSCVRLFAPGFFRLNVMTLARPLRPAGKHTDASAWSRRCGSQIS